MVYSNSLKFTAEGELIPRQPDSAYLILALFINVNHAFHISQAETEELTTTWICLVYVPQVIPH